MNYRSVVVWICISLGLMILSVFSWTYSPFFCFLEKCLFRSFAHFTNRLFTFLLLSRGGSLHIPGTSPLSHVQLVKLFCACFLTFLMVSCNAQKVLFYLLFFSNIRTYWKFILKNVIVLKMVNLRNQIHINFFHEKI